MNTMVEKPGIIIQYTEKALLVKFRRCNKFTKAIWVPKKYIEVADSAWKRYYKNSRFETVSIRINKWFYENILLKDK